MRNNQVNTLETRFWKKVDKTVSNIFYNGTRCWEWHGSINGKGYGTISQDTNNTPHSLFAHRLSYELHKGIIPVGKQINHFCNNRQCVNPDHLQLGNQSQNIKQSVNEGRKISSNLNGIPSIRGENHYNCKLSINDVLKIIGLWERGNFSQTEIAELFGTTQSRISMIVNNKERKYG